MRTMMVMAAMLALAACAGETGPVGQRGADGQDGSNGAPGVDGADGMNGAPGPGQRWRDGTGAVVPVVVVGFDALWRDDDGVWWPVQTWSGLVDLDRVSDTVAVYEGSSCTGTEHVFVGAAGISFSMAAIRVGGELRHIESASPVGESTLSIASTREVDGTCTEIATQVDASRYVDGDSNAPATAAPVGRAFVPLLERELVE